MLGLIGKKMGMTQLFDDDGKVIPVTVIQAGPCPIVQVKTDERDGYRAVQIGFGAKKPRRSNRPGSGHAAGAGLDYEPAHLREFRLGADEKLAEDPHSPAKANGEGAGQGGGEAEEAESGEGNGEAPEAEEGEAPEGGAAEVAEAEATEAPEAESAAEPQVDLEAGLRVGLVLTVAIFEPGERVKVSGNSKGRGFQGVVKRHGFSGYPKSHGHPYMRVPGSIGPGTDPSRTIKGRKMGGRMGGKRRSVRNLEVVRVDAERNMLFVRGSIPGARNAVVTINKQ